MTDWRAGSAQPPTSSRGYDPSPATRKRREGSYVPPPPDLVEITTLAALLPSSRAIPPDQQERFGFADDRIWCAGDRTLVNQRCVAIVGTRNLSADGAKRARRLARELSEAGIVVVSGLARGADTEALSSAIEAGGRVAAVIGTPIDKAYPAENKRLQERIYREHLLVSQFAPGSRVFPGNFPARNKLMAALTDATVIIEATDTSGTLHQAAECARLGRWLFIARSVLDDASLTWPKNFTKYATTRALSSTADIVQALTPCP